MRWRDLEERQVWRGFMRDEIAEAGCSPGSPRRTLGRRWRLEWWEAAATAAEETGSWVSTAAAEEEGGALVAGSSGGASAIGAAGREEQWAVAEKVNKQIL